MPSLYNGDNFVKDAKWILDGAIYNNAITSHHIMDLKDALIGEIRLPFNQLRRDIFVKGYDLVDLVSEWEHWRDVSKGTPTLESIAKTIIVADILIEKLLDLVDME